MAMKSAGAPPKDSGQLSLFDDLLTELSKAGGKLTSAQITAAINKLKSARENAKKREDKERAKKEKEEAAQKTETHIREVTSMDLPMDWENLYTGDPRAVGVHADSIPDGLILSLTNLGRVDIPYISSITGSDLKTVILTLKGSIYQNPDGWNECFYEGWETAEEYLSGNMVQKWKRAKAANETYKGYFADNVAAIEKVLPPTLSSDDIYITLGSPWVPEEVIDDFIRHILRLKDTFGTAKTAPMKRQPVQPQRQVVPQMQPVQPQPQPTPMKRTAKHCKLSYAGMLAERQRNLKEPFMNEEKEEHARAFAKSLI